MPGSRKPERGLQMSSDDVAIRVSNLSKRYEIYNNPRDRLKQLIMPRLRHIIGRKSKQYFREFWALNDISFKINKGETVGIIGRNGSGKSTLLQIICGTLHPSHGIVETSGRIAALLELGSGFNPEFTGRENVYMNASVLGLDKNETDLKFDDIVAFADIGNFIDQPVKAYSSGMMVRLAFGVAINVNPQILVVDEALAVGDAAFQRKCMRKIEELTSSGTTLLFVSHDTETVKKICSRAIYLNAGIARLEGKAKEVCTEYERDLFGASKGGDSKVKAEEKSPEESTFLDPALLSTDEKVYGDGRAVIDAISITDTDRQPINVIPAGAAFVVTYNVKFIDMVSRPILGMMITSREGICIFGTNTTDLPVSARKFHSGDEIQVSFNLTNNLGPGIYYLTCGIHSQDHTEGLIYVQRRMDACLLRSLGHDGDTASGTSNLFPLINVE